jgi:serine/threonine-protein kinase
MNVTLVEGTIFAGRYRVGRRLAMGAMGAVYEAVHLDTDRRRALKVMHAHLFESDEMRERFQREARIAANVDSEFIVDVSDAGVDEATRIPFLVMELLRGEELGVRLKRLGRLPPDEVLTYMQQAAVALDRTHAQSIIHRDLKPANLFLTYRDDGTPRIKILDFGVAKVVAEGAKSAGTTQILGTPLYMAPEQFQAETRLTPAVDIHALGMMTYTLLVGEAYWTPEARRPGGAIVLALTILRGAQEPATWRAAACGVTLSPGFDAWFAKITAVNPADRFARATEAVRALGEALRVTTGTLTPVQLAPPILGYPVVSAAAGSPPRSSDVLQENAAASVGFPASAQSGGALLEGAATSTSAAMAPASLDRSRRPMLAVASAIGGVVLAVAAWLGLRGVMASPAAARVTTVSAISDAPAAPLASAIEVAIIAAAAPAGLASAAPIEASASAPATAAPRPASTGTGVAARAPAAPVVQKKPATKLFGRE